MIEILIAALVGIGAGVGGFAGYQQTKQVRSKEKIARDLANAKNKASDIVLKAKDEALKIENERRRELQKVENRLADREKTLDSKIDELDKRAEIFRREGLQRRLDRHEDERKGSLSHL